LENKGKQKGQIKPRDLQQTNKIFKSHPLEAPGTHTPTIGMGGMVKQPQHKTINNNTKDKVSNILTIFPLILTFLIPRKSSNVIHPRNILGEIVTLDFLGEFFCVPKEYP
jgi:hypothetical protein